MQMTKIFWKENHTGKTFYVPENLDIIEIKEIHLTTAST